METNRRGFLKTLGMGAAAVVTAPVLAKVASAPTNPETLDTLHETAVAFQNNPDVLGPPQVEWFSVATAHEAQAGNPHAITKTQLGLGDIRRIMQGEYSDR